MKSNLTENSIIKILWNFMGFINPKIQFTFKLSFYKVGNYMTKFKPNTNLLQLK